MPASLAISEPSCNGFLRHLLIAKRKEDAYPFRMTLKIHIREIRQDRGLTLKDLADQIGISVPHLSEVERGLKKVNNHILERLSDALQTPPESLISGSGSDRVARISFLSARLGDEDNAKLEAFAEALYRAAEAAGQKK